jgi:hypothetical protein
MEEMDPAAEDVSPIIAQISFVGRSGGAVKSLSGFRKGHHTIPDAVNPATQRFLAQLCASDLAAEGERWFQQIREALGYRRKELCLELSSPIAMLVAKDFVFEIEYALKEEDPATYREMRSLRRMRSGDLLQSPEFDQLFAGQFSAVALDLKRGVRVETVIDAIEGLDGERGAALKVSYPSDCRWCSLAVEGVAAEVVCDGATLELRFPRNGSPLELMVAFEATRAAFRLSGDPALAGLVG